MRDLITDDLLERCETENEQALCKCLMTSNMMLETYSKEVNNPVRQLLILDMMKLNNDIILQTIGLI